MEFKSFIYKYELPLGSDALFERDDDYWECLCDGIASRGFTGIVFYAGYHPFSKVLDYKNMPEAAEGSARNRTRTRNRLNQILAIAKKYNLQTFIQHYVMHFTANLAKSAGLNIKLGSYARLAGYDVPAVRDYCRYCYREIFKQCPDLDGLYFNFESVSSVCKHVTETAIREANKMKKKPIFFYRLWGMLDPEGMNKVVKAYKGRSIFGHKIPERADVYHMPVADSRVREWKKAVPGIEFAFLAGPCHNCATNIEAQVWADYDFMQTMLADAKAKGADSISFNSSQDLLSPRMQPFNAKTTPLSIYNILHLEL